MSITRALVELNTLDSRINKTIEKLIPVEIVTGKNIPRGYKTIEEFNKKAREDYQSVVDLIKRRNSIKGAIVKANATTNVKIGEKEMTIAQAIEYKNSIKYEEALLKKLNTYSANSLRTMEQMDVDIQMRLQRLLETNFGKDSKAKSEEYDAIAKPFLEGNAPKLIDPIDIKATLKKHEDAITAFKGDVDTALSEINAKTDIEIEG